MEKQELLNRISDFIDELHLDCITNENADDKEYNIIKELDNYSIIKNNKEKFNFINNL